MTVRRSVSSSAEDLRIHLALVNDEMQTGSHSGLCSNDVGSWHGQLLYHLISK